MLIFFSVEMSVGLHTIVYGSNDGGRTVHNDSLEFEKKIEEVAKQLNLKKHPVAEQELYTSALTEGHLGLVSLPLLSSCSSPRCFAGPQIFVFCRTVAFMLQAVEWPIYSHLRHLPLEYLLRAFAYSCDLNL